MFWADLAHHAFGAQTLLFSVPYQILRVEPCEPVEGVVIQFHVNFLCIETYHGEVGCNGVLFSDGCGVPLVRLDGMLALQFAADVDALRAQLAGAELAQSEALVSQLARSSASRACRWPAARNSGRVRGSGN
jgi:hypothetical protein